MGFEQTIEEYKQAKRELAGGPEGDQEFIRAMALQKAWSDRMCEVKTDIDAEKREDLAIETVSELGEWFRTNVMEFPADPGKKSRKHYYLELFDRDPEQAVQELYTMYRSGLH